MSLLAKGLSPTDSYIQENTKLWIEFKTRLLYDKVGKKDAGFLQLALFKGMMWLL